MGALALDLDTCGARVVKLERVSSAALRAHGAILVAAWAYAAPLGWVAARAKRADLTSRPLWLRAHQGLQMAAVVLTLAGIFKAVLAVAAAAGADHLEGRHPKLGVGVAAAVAANAVLGLLRPRAPAPGAAPTRARAAFEVAHRLLGFGALGLGAVTLLAGIHRAGELDHVDAVAAWNTAVVAPLAVAAASAAGLTLYIKLLPPKNDAAARASKTSASPPASPRKTPR